jgi:hypothetical protein
MNKPEKTHVDAVARIGCVICREFYATQTDCEIHHIGEGSGHRSNFMVAGLCQSHHRESAGLHGMGVKAFLRLYKLPTEYHLLDLVNKFRAQDGV